MRNANRVDVESIPLMKPFFTSFIYSMITTPPLQPIPCFLQETFCSLRQLVRLDLSKNALKELPQEFGNLNQLKELDLYCNQLSGLPLSCVNLKNLIWLDLKSNPVQKLWPDVIGNCLSKAECKQCAKNVSCYK